MEKINVQFLTASSIFPSGLTKILGDAIITYLNGKSGLFSLRRRNDLFCVQQNETDKELHLLENDFTNSLENNFYKKKYSAEHEIHAYGSAGKYGA